ncbi:hypothetical protein H4R34_003003 [Dimargaris verticillata]|uniref:Globin n=1 Tax=Dimargaris verticillata TaxID=2761393 RepID=A0A9W8B8C6_9FUNG|nr:hypothetical protein H4R34_003003 [Dimargaris verticillata]
MCFGRRKKNKSSLQQSDKPAAAAEHTSPAPIAQRGSSPSNASKAAPVTSSELSAAPPTGATPYLDSASAPMRQHQLANLDEQLLATVVDKIYEYCLADDRVRHYFRSSDRGRLSNMQLKFLKHAIAGTPYNTTGMRVAHRRMVDLKDYHFDAILENWRKAFVDCGVPDDYTELVLAVAEQSRDDILGRS